MPYIRETIITTVDRAGKVHIAPIGIIAEGESWVIAPFRPSITLDNLAQVPFAVANYTDDVRFFAGCLTGRKDWPTLPVDGGPVQHYTSALDLSPLIEPILPAVNDRDVRQALSSLNGTVDVWVGASDKMVRQGDKQVVIW